MKPPDIGVAKRAARNAMRCNIAHRPDLMQALALAWIRGTDRRGFVFAEDPRERPEQKVTHSAK